MTNLNNPITRRSMVKVLAAAPILATPLAFTSPASGKPYTESADSRTRRPVARPPLAHQTLIGVL